MEHGFTWLSKIPFLNSLPEHNLIAFCIMLLLVICAVLINRRLKTKKSELAPEDKLSLFTIFEIAIEKLRGLFESIMGEETDHFMGLLCSTFIFIFIANLLGVIPGFIPPTSNININAACAIVIFVATHYYGIKAHKMSYIKQFMGPMLAIAFLLFPIEIVSHIARPLSLTMRLLGNINGDHIVLSQFSSLAPLVVPVIFMAFGIFVAFVQAFIFSVLSCVYISLAISHDH